jgi:hypothetical protein
MSIGITIAIIILLALLIACIGIWNSNTDTSIDYDLYGMDAEEYLKKEVGEEYYIKYYKE